MVKPPSNNTNNQNDGTDKSFSIMVEGDLHYSPNDIAELRKLADAHPELATQIAADKRAANAMEENTERLGMLFAVILAVVLVFGTSFTLVNLGWWQSTMFVGALLGISHVLRTLLKGEFSDTSWFGKIMNYYPKNNRED